MEIINKCIYILGQKKRNPHLKSYYDFLMESDHWSYDELEQYQLEKCKELLCFAYEYSDFYHSEFDSVGFNPYEFSTINDLKKIPIIDKKIVINNNDRIHTKYKFNKCFYSETSGTSGEALKFYRNEEWDSRARAGAFRGYSWYDVKPWDRNGYFWGYNIEKSQKRMTEFRDLLQNRFRLFSYNYNEIVKFTKKLRKAQYIGGYSSMIYEVAKIINNLGIQDQYHLKMIKGTSEKIYDSYQSEVKKAFGLKMISQYGSAETGLIAFECPEGHMHIAMESVVVEEVEGEIVVTNLFSKSFPIIRYKLGDFIKLASSNFKCKCGRSHPVILDILGRVGKKIVGKTNIYPSLTFYYVFKNLNLNNSIELNYQAIQNEKGKILLKIEQSSSQHQKELEYELSKYFKNDIDFTILWGQTLHKMDGKLKDFITTIN